jgi:tetratricopeptide (TPR) repeat protein
MSSTAQVVPNQPLARGKDRTGAVRWLSRATEACLALAVLVPPFFFGGREAPGQAVLALIVLAASGCCAFRWLLSRPCGFPWRRPEFFLPLACLALSLVSWMPLPAPVVRALSPGIGRLLPCWTTGEMEGLGRGGWTTLSVAPGLSRDESFLFLLYALLFWVTASTVSTVDGVRRLFGAFLVCGVGVAAVGLLNYLFWNGKFYGLWELWWVPPDRQVRAPFTNRNHFAGFLALTIGPGMAWLAGVLRHGKGHAIRRGSSGSPRGASLGRGGPAREFSVLLAALGILLIYAGTLFSQSRGGVIVGSLALAASTLALFKRGIIGGRGLAAVAGAALVGLGAVLALDGGTTYQRLARMLSGCQTLDEFSNQRLWLWKSDLHALGDFPVLGSGPGTHRLVYPLYLEKAHRFTYTHAESCYVQVLVECGLAGAALMVAAVVCVAGWCLRGVQSGHRSRTDFLGLCSLAVGSSILAALVHALVDFVWYVPAYAAALAVLAGLASCLCRMRTSAASELSRPVVNEAGPPRGRRLPWGIFLGVGGAVVAVLLVIHFRERLGSEAAWNAYYHLLPSVGGEKSPEPDQDSLDLQARWLAEACSHPPGDPDPFYRLGVVTLQQFLTRARPGGKPLTLPELRQCLMDAKDATAAEKEAKLKSLCGGDWTLLRQSRASFRRALECCPLLGPAYLKLAELNFLELPVPPDPAPYCRQALLVRPNDPTVCLQVGRESLVAGDLPAARQCWRRACQLDPNCQEKLLPVLAECPPEEVIGHIPLSLESLRWIAQRHAQRGRAEAQRYVSVQARKAVERNPRWAKNPESWAALHDLFRQAGLLTEAEGCLRKVIPLAPRQVGYQVQLVHCFLDEGKWDEALEQAHRARECFPENPEVRDLQGLVLRTRTSGTPARPGQPQSLTGAVAVGPN